MPRFITIKNRVEELLPSIKSYYEIYKGMTIPDSAFERLLNSLSSLFNTDYRIMAMSCNRLKDTELTESSIRELLWRLIANRNILKEGRPVLYYDHYTFSNVEEIQFVSVKGKDDVYKTKIRVLTGHYAPNVIKREFSSRGMYNVLRTCGFHGRKYIAGRVEESLPGLYAKADLVDWREDPRVLKELIPSDDITAFNRKNVIGPRMNLVSCPFSKEIGITECIKCSVCRDKCLASYKEKEND